MDKKTGMQEPVELTPEVIADLSEDLLAVIKRCPDCGSLFVRKHIRAKTCRACAVSRHRSGGKGVPHKEPESLEEITPEIIAALGSDLESVVKRCRECGRPIVLNFGAKKFCRNCLAKRQREKKIEGARKYYQAHRDEICAARREKYARDKEPFRLYNAKYYALHSVQIKAKVVEYQLNNKDAVAARHAEYCQKNKEKIRAYQREYQKKYRENHRYKGAPLSPEKVAALKAYRAAYYAANKERIQAQRKDKKERDKAKKEFAP